MNKTTNTVSGCVDWFRCTLPECTDVSEFCSELSKIDSRLSIDNFVYHGCAILNYSNRYDHCSCPSLIISWNPLVEEDISCFIARDKSLSNNPGIMLSFSGDALRFLGDITLKRVFKYLSKLKINVTRIDLALDFYNKENDIVPLLGSCLDKFLYSEKGDYTVKTKLHRTPKNFKKFINVYPDTGKVTENYTIGNHGSQLGMFRLYDKLYELSYGRLDKYSAELCAGKDYWYRAELELHGYHAQEAFMNIVGGHSVESAWALIMPSFFVPCILKYNGKSHISESDTVVIWDEWLYFLTNNIHFVQLVKDSYVDIRAARTMQWFRTMAKSFAVASYFNEKLPGIFDDIISNGKKKLYDKPDPKYSWLRDFLLMPNNSDLDIQAILKELEYLDK